MKIIEEKAAKEKNAVTNNKDSQNATEMALRQVRELEPRITDLISIANKCIREGIQFPPSEETAKYGYGNGKDSYCFYTDDIHKHVGFMDISPLKPTQIMYIGINGGGFNGTWDFCTNGKQSFLQHEGLHIEKECELSFLQAFLNEFDVFEKAFYNWIDSLAE